MLILWILVFLASLYLLVKGADWLIISSEKIGLVAGLSPFIVGVIIVGLGTSMPELFSSFVAISKGVNEVVVANAVGSNIANILLIIGLASLIGKKIIVKKNLIDLDLPLLAISTVLLLGVVWDKQVTLGESILMLATFGIYIIYTVTHKESDEEDEDEIFTKKEEKELVKPKLSTKDFVLLAIGILGLVVGAKYLIDALINISQILQIGTGVIAITAVAVGTSLPELLVSVKAAFQNKPEVALGNIFGSNIFNALVVVGLPGLFARLPVDSQTYAIGLPTMALATLLFIISGISRKVYMWEGLFYLSVYILFIAKLFNWF